MNDNDTTWTEEVVCPYCGEIGEDSWEIEQDEGTNVCGSCEHEYFYERLVEITYTTRRLEGGDFLAEGSDSAYWNRFFMDDLGGV